MPVTGYEVRMYADITRIANALERIARHLEAPAAPPTSDPFGALQPRTDVPEGERKARVTETDLSTQPAPGAR